MPAFAGEPASWSHHLVEIGPELKLHYVDAPPTNQSGAVISAGRTILLIHGFPQTWCEFRLVIPPLTSLGLRVIAVDYRGAGSSTRPVGGYDKMTMGRDLAILVREKLRLQKVVVLGHDIGSMVAVGMALQNRDLVEALLIMEGPSPGTKVYDQITRDDKYTYGPLFHWFFHTQPDLPELLTQDADSYSQPGAMRAGFDTYRAFRQDRTDFQQHIKANPKLAMPVLAAAGDAGFMADFYEDMAKEFCDDVSFATVKNSGHWMPEENPVGFFEMIRDFLKAKQLL